MIFIVNNRKNNKGEKFFSKLTQFLGKKKIDFLVATPFEKEFKTKLKTNLKDILLVIILGGDGTILYTFNHFIEKIKKDSIPFFALNIGNVGYISSMDDTANALAILKNYLIKEYLSKSCSIYNEEKINCKEVKIEKRFFLEGFFPKKKKNFFALNEITFRRKLNKIIYFECFINDKLICKLRSDGIILATPTGSTAYNLSANGPILNPLLPAFIFNPLCPHSLSFKPLVLGEKDTIKIRAMEKILLSVDGKEDISIGEGEDIQVKLSQDFLPILKPIDENCYSVLTKKLNWGK